MIVVVGDVLLDRDVTGVTDRLCPDAPVPVLTEMSRSQRPGGAGLAATLLAFDGTEVVLLCGLGQDTAGDDVRTMLVRCGVKPVEIPYDGNTAEKIRLRAGTHPLIRLDRGDARGSFGDLPAVVADVLRAATAVLVSDYGRGITGVPALRRHLADVAEAGVPIVWDPHPKGSTPVPGVGLACPNRAEAAAFCALHGADLDTHDPAGGPGVAAEAALLRTAWRVSAVAVTLGAGGAVVADDSGKPISVAAPAAGDGDTCGAGDRFAATAVTRLAAGDDARDAVTGAVHAASAYVADNGPEALTSKLATEATSWLAHEQS
jgi:D-beta-D-heptose 7-phosphate kinase/D-beta-D-heptose 1-phosphate adenosyltransferase